MEKVLEVINLRKTFKLSKKQQKIERLNNSIRVAVNNLSFTANKGEIFGLLGPNGAGKTTTLRIISTLIKADGGDVLVNGKSVLREAYEVRSQIGFLTSELKLEGFFTPNYLFDFFSKLYGVEESVRDERKKKLFEKFGIDKFAEVKVNDLSTGMKQKLSIAVSLVHNPSVIVFDEPTNGLDVITAKTVTDYLLELKNEGKTIIISTHIFSLVEKLCDRVGVIIDGEMVLESVFFDLYLEKRGEL